MTNQPPLGAAVHITGSTPSSGVDDYTLLAGKTSAAHDVYNDVMVQVTEGASPGRRFAVEARVYNSAAAFRFELDTVVPQAPHRKLRPVLYDSWEATAFKRE